MRNIAVAMYILLLSPSTTAVHLAVSCGHPGADYIALVPHTQGLLNPARFTSLSAVSVYTML